MNDLYLEFTLILGFSIAIAMLLIAARTGIQYDLSPCELVISWFGFHVRNIPLDDIVSITTRRVWWAENWSNALLTRRRRLVVRRRSGFFKDVVITPEKTYVFRSELIRTRATYLLLLNTPGADTDAPFLPHERQHSPLAA